MCAQSGTEKLDLEEFEKLVLGYIPFVRKLWRLGKDHSQKSMKANQWTHPASLLLKECRLFQSLSHLQHMK